MAENSVILSVEEEAKLLQPIDEYVGKIQDQIDALRVDGTDQVNSISNCIAIAKENKNLSTLGLILGFVIMMILDVTLG